MSIKRTAATELNHDNWNEEHEPEEAGVFTKASEDVLEKRVVKRAKRRLPPGDDVAKSAFSTFAGFKTTGSAQSSPFSFLASTAGDPVKTNTNVYKLMTSNGATKGSENGADKSKHLLETQSSSNVSPNKKIASEHEDEKIFKKSTAYFAKLKGLNESVAQWIKSHVDSNPFCILTPIFKDYERYLKEIESKHGNETEKAIQSSESGQAKSPNIKNNEAVTEKKSESSIFSGTGMKPMILSEWKPEKSIFGNISTGTKSMFGKPQNTTDSTKSVFSNTDQTSDTPKSIFSNLEQKSSNTSVFGNKSPEKNPFLSKPSSSDNKSNEEDTKSDAKPTSSSFPTSNVNAGIFSFGQSTTANIISAGFSFGSANPFSFGAQAVKPQDSAVKEDNESKDDEDDEPPKVDIKPITEEGAIYEQRCKVFIKKDGNFSDRGIGILFLKPTPTGKTQLIVRAETSLGNLLLNTLLTENIPTKRMSKNTVMMVCLPMPESSPPPVPVLLRVKTDQDADVLFETLNKHKK